MTLVTSACAAAEAERLGPPAGMAAAWSEWPAWIVGGGTNDWPGKAPASMREKTERQEAWTESGLSFHAWYMSSMSVEGRAEGER